jgi:hypothetical protein
MILSSASTGITIGTAEQRAELRDASSITAMGNKFVRGISKTVRQIRDKVLERDANLFPKGTNAMLSLYEKDHPHCEDLHVQSQE